MRTIREMLGNDEKVWIYINGEDTWKMFVNMAVTEGFHFGELPAEKWAFGHAVAVHSNGKMGHLPLFVWCLSFQKGVCIAAIAADCKSATLAVNIVGSIPTLPTNDRISLTGKAAVC